MRPTCLHALLPLCNSRQYRCVASAGTCRIVDTSLPNAHGGAAPQTRVDQCWLTVLGVCNANIPAALLWQHQQPCETSHCQCEHAVNCQGWGWPVPRWHTATRAHVLCRLMPQRPQQPTAAALWRHPPCLLLLRPQQCLRQRTQGWGLRQRPWRCCRGAPRARPWS